MLRNNVAGSIDVSCSLQRCVRRSSILRVVRVEGKMCVPTDKEQECYRYTCSLARKHEQIVVEHVAVVVVVVHDDRCSGSVHIVAYIFKQWKKQDLKWWKIRSQRSIRHVLGPGCVCIHVHIVRRRDLCEMPLRLNTLMLSPRRDVSVVCKTSEREAFLNVRSNCTYAFVLKEPKSSQSHAHLLVRPRREPAQMNHFASSSFVRSHKNLLHYCKICNSMVIEYEPNILYW